MNKKEFLRWLKNEERVADLKYTKAAANYDEDGYQYNRGLAVAFSIVRKRAQELPYSDDLKDYLQSRILTLQEDNEQDKADMCKDILDFLRNS